MPSTPSATDRHISPKIITLMNDWKRLHRAWWASHYGIGLAGIIAGVAAGGLSDGTAAGGATTRNLLSLGPALFGILAAIATSLVTFLGPQQKAEKYWRAYHHLHQAIYEFEEGLIDRARLNRAIKKARNVILMGIGNPQPEHPEENDLPSRPPSSSST